MNSYKVVYFYSTVDDYDGSVHQGWGSDGPYEIPEGQLTMAKIESIQNDDHFELS